MSNLDNYHLVTDTRDTRCQRYEDPHQAYNVASKEVGQEQHTDACRQEDEDSIQ